MPTKIYNMDLARIILKMMFVLACFQVTAQESSITISGRVTDGDRPLPNVNITVENSSVKTVSDREGKYKIVAKPYQTLIFTRMGLKTVRLILEDVSSIMNIEMYPQIQELDEVIVEKTKIKREAELQKEYQNNKNLIRTAFGIMDKDKIGYSMRVIDGNSLAAIGIDFLTALQARVPGMRVVRSPNDPTNPQVYLRGGRGISTSPPAAFEVDGTIFQGVPTFIPVQNIDRIAVIPSVGAGARYGRQASGGLIIINTKSGNALYETGTSNPFDFAKVRNNIFEPSDVHGFENTTKPQYLLDFQNSSSVKEAYAIFEKERLIRGDRFDFFLDAADFFLSRGAASKSEEIISMAKEKFSNNPNTLKAIAYWYEKNNDYGSAIGIYEEVLKKRPRHGQSFRDLANAHYTNGDFKKSLEIYSRYIVSRNLDTSVKEEEGIDAIIKTEFQNVLKSNSAEMSNTTIQTGMYDNFSGSRVLLEWNNGEAEFDLQFVNPDNRFYTWSHTYEKNSEQINLEKIKGFSSKQFMIDEMFRGVWQVNLKYFGNKSYLPTYIKATVFHNFGQENETRKSYYFKLVDKEVNQKLFSIVNNPEKEAK